MQNYKDNIGAIILLIIGIGVASVSLIFVGALGGQTYNLVESDIDAIAPQTQTQDTFVVNVYWVQLNHTALINGSYTIYNGTTAYANGTADFNINDTDGTIMYEADAWAGNIGQVYTIVYKYNDPTMRTYIKDSIAGSFKGLKQTGSYMPLVVLAVIIFLVLSMVVGLTGMGGVMGGNKNGPYSGAL